MASVRSAIEVACSPSRERRARLSSASSTSNSRGRPRSGSLGDEQRFPWRHYRNVVPYNQPPSAPFVPHVFLAFGNALPYTQHCGAAIASSPAAASLVFWLASAGAQASRAVALRGASVSTEMSVSMHPAIIGSEPRLHDEFIFNIGGTYA